MYKGNWGLPRKASHGSSTDPENVTVVSPSIGGLIANWKRGTPSTSAFNSVAANKKKVTRATKVQLIKIL